MPLEHDVLAVWWNRPSLKRLSAAIPLEIFPEEGKPTPKKLVEETKKAPAVSSLHTHCVLAKQDHNRLNAEDLVRGKYLVTIKARALVPIAGLDTTVGLPKRKLTKPYVLQIASEEILPLLKEALVILTVVLPTDVLDVRLHHGQECPITVSCAPTMHLWTWGTVCSAWAMMKCYKYYGASVCDHVHPPI
jgi:hypothetical protein